MKHIITIATLLPLLLLGCKGDDPPFEGIYQTNYETENLAGCDAEGDPVQSNAYFRLEWVKVEGQSQLAFGTCTSPEPEQCHTVDPDNGFCEHGDEMVRAEISMTYSPSTQVCTLRYIESVLTSVGEDLVRIESRTHSEDVGDMTEEECNADEAIARGTSMPCVSLHVLEGIEVDD